MLESIVCLFSLAGILFCKMAIKEDRFSLPWYSYLCASFTSLGLALTTKFSSTISLSYVSFELLLDSWSIFKDSKQKIATLCKDVLIKIILMGSIITAICTCVFVIHIILLQSEGEKPVDAMSPRFRASLHNAVLPEATPEILHYGARIVLKHYQDSNYYLHSHPHVYPNGSNQQQVTEYSFHDVNNIFIVRKGMKPRPTVVGA